MSDVIISSKFKTFNIIFYIFGILFIAALCFFVCFSKFKINDIATYRDLVSGCFLAILPIYILYYILSLPKINVYSDRIEMQRFLGLIKRNLFRAEINSWLVRKKESKYGNYEFLYLTTNQNKTIKFSSYDYANFEEVKHNIINNKPQNCILKEKLDRKQKIQLSIILTLSGILFMYITSQFYRDDTLTKNDLYIIKGTLSKDIELERHKKSKSLVFKLENLENFEFKIGSLTLKETYYEDLMQDFKMGDEIYLSIRKEQYEQKIIKKVPMSFWDKYFHYDTIEIIEVDNRNFKYLSLSDFNKVNRNNDYWGIGFFGIFGILLTITGIYIYPKNKKLYFRD